MMAEGQDIDHESTAMNVIRPPGRIDRRRETLPSSRRMKPLPLAALLLAANPGLHAQNTAPAASTPDAGTPLIVTASRISEESSEAPYSVETIDSAFLRDTARRSIPDALRYTPGILVQKTTHGHGSPFIRGFTGRQNLLLFDGVRLNNSTWRGGPVQYWNTVDPLSVDHIELVRNQGSVLYGSDAGGGTVNLFGKSPEFNNQSEGNFYQKGSAFYEFRSSGQGSHIGRVEAETGVGGRFGVILGASIKDFGDIEDGAVGRMRGTGYPEQDFDLKAGWAVDPRNTLTFAHYSVNQDDVSRWHRTLANPGWIHGTHVAAPGEFTANTYDQERSLTYLRHEGKDDSSGAAVRRWSTTLSWQTSRDSEFQNRNPSKDDLRRTDIDLNTLGVDIQLESRLGPGLLVYGVDYYQDSVDSSGFKTDAAGSFRDELLPVADDSDYHLAGAFAQYEWKPLDPLAITAGARYSFADATLGRFTDASGTPQNSVSADWDSLVGSLRAMYRIDPAWGLFGGVSQAFRAPNLNDLSGNQTSKSSTASLGSVDVNPERFLTFETGVRHDSESFALQASVFHTGVDDLITDTGYDTNGDGITDGSITTNAAEAYSYGFELGGAWRFAPQWTLSGFTAWQEGREESPEILGGMPDSRPMSRSYPLTGSLALRWDDPDGRFWVEGRITAASNEDRITAADQADDDQRIPTNGTPGYAMASVYGGWNIRQNLELTLGLENLTDEDYRIHGSGQNETGFQTIVGLRASW